MAPRTGAAETERTLVDRFLAAFPLLAVFFWLAVIYAWEAWRHGSPWLFGDELELTQLSRSIAETGHAARRGHPHSFDSLYTYFIAPAWRIGNLQHAYDAVKYLNVLAMTATAFPAYKIARFLVGRRAALFAATGAVLIPALAYTSLILQESLAYPYSTLCIYLILGALVRRTRWWIGGAAAASLLAPAVRGELAVIPAVFLFAALFLLWRSQAAAGWRARWRTADWIGAVVLVIGIAIFVSAFLGHRSTQWLIATGFYKHRMFTLGMRAAGAFTIGLGILPLVAGLASLWRAPGEVFRWELRVFRSVLLAAILCFGTYTAVKAAWVSTTFATQTVERNLIYLAPLLMAGTALWIERRSIHPLAVGAASLFALYLVLTTPYEMEKRLDADAFGLAILQRLNRVQMFAFTPGVAKVLLLVILVASVAVLLVPRYVRRGALPVVVLAGAFVLVWNGLGELSAASASNAFSRSFLSNINGTPTWIDDITRGAPTLYLGQQIQDPNSEQLLEFFNRSVKQVWSLDGTAPGPGPTLTPDLAKTDGTLTHDPGYRYVVAEQGIDMNGQIVGTHQHRAGGAYKPWALYRLSGPLQLRSAVTGLYADGWSGPYDSAYTRYSSPGGRGGTVHVNVSWHEWAGPNTAKVTVTMGTVAIGPDKQPAIGKALEVKQWTIRAHEEKTFVLRAPGPRFRVQVAVDPHFHPHDYDPSNGDRRELGAVVKYRFVSSQRKRT